MGQQEVESLQDVDLLVWGHVGQQQFEDRITIMNFRTCADHQNTFGQRTVRKLRELLSYQDLTHVKPKIHIQSGTIKYLL